MKRALWGIALFLAGAAPLHATVYSVGLDKNQFTSDFMIGKVVVGVVFVESDGTMDPNTETWSEARKSQALSKIMAGHAWWTQQNPRSPLSFTYVVKTLNTRYEPIARPYYQESYWIPDALGKLGYSGSRFTASRDYINALRAQYKTDWGFLIFVVDSLNDSDGKFSDGYFAYAYLGGPFIVMTYDNGGYGIGNMDVVAAHETGHIFNALDEYAGASSPNDYSYGYFPTINGNHEWSSIANSPNSIMRGGLRWGLDDWARLMLGWRDSNKNNVDDILDLKPDITLSQQTQSSNETSVVGQAKIKVLARQDNTSGYGMTLDTISKVEYRINGSGEWKTATASDGTFDSAQESFTIVVPESNIQTIQTQSLTPESLGMEIRALTSYTQNAGASSGGTQVTGAGTLSNAHAFPNPYKPNSGLNHTGITFAGLTAGAKVEIFTPTGEPVYDATATGSTLPWSAIDKDGSSVASGVYLFLITDPSGNSKEGKIAIIR